MRRERKSGRDASVRVSKRACGDGARSLLTSDAGFYCRARGNDPCDARWAPPTKGIRPAESVFTEREILTHSDTYLLLTIYLRHARSSRSRPEKSAARTPVLARIPPFSRAFTHGPRDLSASNVRNVGKKNQLAEAVKFIAASFGRQTESHRRNKFFYQEDSDDTFQKVWVSLSRLKRRNTFRVSHRDTISRERKSRHVITAAKPLYALRTAIGYRRLFSLKSSIGSS